MARINDAPAPTRPLHLEPPHLEPHDLEPPTHDLNDETLLHWNSTIYGGSAGMLKVLAFLTKREDIETRAFIEYYESNHVPLICRLAPIPIVYKRNYPVRDGESNRDDATDFDVVTELVFPDRAAYLAWGAAVGTGAAGEQVVADELKFLDRSRTKSYVVEEYVTSG